MAQTPTLLALTDAERALIEPLLESLRLLDEAFYGTLVLRDAGEHPRAEMKRAADGWRHGVSHPFVYQGTANDVQLTPDAKTGEPEFNPDASRAVYERLRRAIAAELAPIQAQIEARVEAEARAEAQRIR